jgi:hypothetical protein
MIKISVSWYTATSVSEDPASSNFKVKNLFISAINFIYDCNFLWTKFLCKHELNFGIFIIGYRIWGPFSLLSNVQGAPFTVVKRQEREADHSPSSAEVKNGGLYIHSSIRLHGVVLIKHMKSFTFLFTL